MVPLAAHAVSDDWRRLAAPVAEPAAFHPDLVAGLPAAAQRWLRHAIAPGTPMWRTAELTMRGQIRLGTWRPFTARQVITPGAGFIWAATARFAGLPVVGFDRYSAGTGQMRWRLLGAIPVMTGAGPDVTRSAAGRLAGEGVFVPTAFAAAEWSDGDEPDTAVATYAVDDQREAVTLRIAADGRLTGVVMQRWGNPAGGEFHRHAFGVTVEAERRFDGVVVPARFRAGWYHNGARLDFFRAEITGVRFRPDGH